MKRINGRWRYPCALALCAALLCLLCAPAASGAENTVWPLKYDPRNAAESVRSLQALMGMGQRGESEVDGKFGRKTLIMLSAWMQPDTTKENISEYAKNYEDKGEEELKNALQEYLECDEDCWRALVKKRLTLSLDDEDTFSVQDELQASDESYHLWFDELVYSWRGADDESLFDGAYAWEDVVRSENLRIERKPTGAEKLVFTAVTHCGGVSVPVELRTLEGSELDEFPAEAASEPTESLPDLMESSGETQMEQNGGTPEESSGTEAAGEIKQTLEQTANHIDVLENVANAAEGSAEKQGVFPLFRKWRTWQVLLLLAAFAAGLCFTTARKGGYIGHRSKPLFRPPSPRALPEQDENEATQRKY